MTLLTYKPLSTMKKWLLFPALTVVLTSLVHANALAQSDELNIEPPPEGELSKEELIDIADDIRSLEENPMAPDFEPAFKSLARWAIQTPDVTVTVCPGLIDVSTMKSDDPIESRLFMMSLLSSTAWLIENPEEADDVAEASLGGIEGMLRFYTAAKEELEEGYSVESAEELLALKEKGELEEFVTEAIGDCIQEQSAEE